MQLQHTRHIQRRRRRHFWRAMSPLQTLRGHVSISSCCSCPAVEAGTQPNLQPILLPPRSPVVPARPREAKGLIRKPHRMSLRWEEMSAQSLNSDPWFPARGSGHVALLSDSASPTSPASGARETSLFILFPAPWLQPSRPCSAPSKRRLGMSLWGCRQTEPRGYSQGHGGGPGLSPARQTKLRFSACLLPWPHKPPVAAVPTQNPLQQFPCCKKLSVTARPLPGPRESHAPGQPVKCVEGPGLCTPAPG